jgi:hypothetical protein
MREDISSLPGDSTVLVACDAPGCRASVEGRPALGEDWPPDWAEDLRRTPMTTGGVRHYCPEHAGLASA